MKKLCVGIVAHVDSGKTTLSEGMLYLSGNIRKIGRVDNGDAFLDTHELERKRGITIFSKQAVLKLEDTEIILLDTPGHVDFSAEMERTLQVLDYAILVISAADGIQGHTRTLWKLLAGYNIPAFIFVNKMDQPGMDKAKVLAELKQGLDDSCVDFETYIREDADMQSFYDETAMCDEQLLEEFLLHGRISEQTIKKSISDRKIFPCFFGSALKLEGVKEFLAGFERLTEEKKYPTEFGARVYKIARDEQDNRLTFMKITGGSLRVRTLLSSNNPSDAWEEKINQIRIYSGVKYDTADEVAAGSICAVTGLSRTYPGEGLGCEAQGVRPVLEPVLNYQILLPEGCDAGAILPKLRKLEEEEPKLQIVWDENLAEIHVQVMGAVQIEILKSLIKERFGIEVEFSAGSIVYKETIADTVEGVGHFEPLRHYAEVHLLMKPGERGSGLEFYSECSEDELDKNWQRLIMTHLAERVHKGVLTGSPITDMKIILIAGRAHIKHTEGGDFRQATYRAVRQGLMQAESVLLEPYYEFRLEVPERMIGRALSDLERMNCIFESPEIYNGTAVITGSVPVVCMRDYPKEVIVYTKGEGRISFEFKGYDICHNADEIITDIDYDAERDLINTADSVFCAHGAGFNVSWDEVHKYMHLEGRLLTAKRLRAAAEDERVFTGGTVEEWIDNEEVEDILSRTFNANKKDKDENSKIIWNKSRVSTSGGAQANAGGGSRPELPDKVEIKSNEQREEYLLVDGYNIIFAWPKLNELAKDNVDSARGRLMDILCNYQALKKCNLILVFDAYRVERSKENTYDYHNIHIVFTKHAETADQYIERFAHDNKKKYNITVATSDGLEQIIIRGQGCRLYSAREFLQEILRTEERLRDEYLDRQQKEHNYLLDIARYL